MIHQRVKMILLALTRVGSMAGPCLFAAILLVTSIAARAEEFATLNDFAGSGLMQTATARMADEGEFAFAYTRVRPYSQYQIFVAPLPWLETTVRYTSVGNRLYSQDPNFSGNQTYKDRSFGLKLRLSREGEYLPAIAVGGFDLGGTGLFGGEYLVASRRYYDLDFSLGMAWGRPGAGGGVRNPLSLVSSHFDQDHQAVSGNNGAGNTGVGRLFTGHDVGIFGGVQWHTPVRGLNLQLEYDSNDYQHEGLDNKFRQDLPINIGVDYAVLKSVNLGAAYERGNSLMLRFNLHTNFERNLGPAKTSDPPPPPVHERRPETMDAPPERAPVSLQMEPALSAQLVKVGPATAQSGGEAVPTDSPADAGAIAQESVVETRKALEAQDITLVAMDVDAAGRDLHVWIRQRHWRSVPKAVGRIARVLTSTAPARCLRFVIIGTESGAEIWRYTVLRREVEALASRRISNEEMAHDTITSPPQGGAPNARFTGLAPLPKFSWDMAPAFRQQIGGPDGFYFGQIYWSVSAGLQLTEHWNLSTALGFNIINNFGDIKLASDSQLPHVRSDIVKYLQEGENNLGRLETNYVWSPASQWYARFSAGIFEEMFGGVAAETLYRPFHERWAVGLDANYVKQRGYRQQFDFRDYEVATGHLSLYYQWPWYDIQTKVSFGRYLARDWGETIDISREFRSGVVFGGFATFTNVSSAKFGEGGFDKGLYISIPFDIFFPRSTRREITFAFRPLTRDGGQKVRDGTELYYVTSGAYGNETVRNWPDVAR